MPPETGSRSQAADRAAAGWKSYERKSNKNDVVTRMRRTRARRTARVVRPAAALAVPAVVRARTPGCSSPITHVGRPADHRIRARLHDETFAVRCSTQATSTSRPRPHLAFRPACSISSRLPLHVERGREVRGVARCVCVKMRVVRRGRPGAPIMDTDKPQSAGADPDSGPRRAHRGRADAYPLE